MPPPPGARGVFPHGPHKGFSGPAVPYSLTWPLPLCVPLTPAQRWSLRDLLWIMWSGCSCIHFLWKPISTT